MFYCTFLHSHNPLHRPCWNLRVSFSASFKLLDYFFLTFSGWFARIYGCSLNKLDNRVVTDKTILDLKLQQLLKCTAEAIAWTQRAYCFLCNTLLSCYLASTVTETVTTIKSVRKTTVVQKLGRHR